MRIIAGSAGRRPIKVPRSVVRPTTDRTREALFSILHQVVEGADCLDLFAGSGALGLEALSRGAASCVFMDQERQSVATIKQNLKDLNLSGGRVQQGDAVSLDVLLQQSFDIVFADPPYVEKPTDRDFVEELLSGGVARVLKPGGYFVAEAPAGRVAALPLGWKVVAQRTYGSCGITVYQKQES